MHLDALSPLKVEVGYGTLGLQGSLGYECKQVLVQGQSYQHALSAHSPSRLLFNLDRRFASFQCQVSINDDVPYGCAYADFAVLADGYLVAVAPHVRAGEPPRSLSADIYDAQLLELIVSSRDWEYTHTVWLDPQVDEMPFARDTSTICDCLSRTEITLPALPLQSHRCIATIASSGYEALLDDMLGSLYINGGCQDALVVVFVISESAACEQVVAKYQAVLIRCQPKVAINATIKSVLYSVTQVVAAEQYLCLDADLLVLNDLRPIFAAIDACPNGSILACREGNNHGWKNLRHALWDCYGGQDTDLELLLGITNGEGDYSLVVNDGLFAGSREALQLLDALIRAMPQATKWVDENPHIWWRNQFIFNLALARLQCGVELDPIYNVQLQAQDVEFNSKDGYPQVLWQERSVRVLHASGVGRNKYPEWRGIFSRLAKPLGGVE
jgi:hypothetical protein